MSLSEASLKRQIVAFTKDWDDVPTCTTHILRTMGKTIPVLWVSSIGTRKPQAHLGKDWRRLLVRVLSGFKRSVLKENKLRVLRPVLIPKAESRVAQWLNRLLFAWYLKRELPDGFDGVIEYWCFVPNAVDFIPLPSVQTKRPSRERHCVVYYCADDWTLFHNLDGAWMAAKERQLVHHATVVFATSRYLEKKLNTYVSTSSKRVVYMSHGVDYAHFSSACEQQFALPDVIADLTHPVIGFYGNLHPWVDIELIASLAHARPQWSFVLIGESYSDLTALQECPNVIVTGRREHTELPSYCRGFDAAIIPYDMKQARMESVNPVKTKELLAAGVPLVASRVPELDGYGDDVILCSDLDDWIKALDIQCGRTKDERCRLSERMKDEDWACKVQAIRHCLEQHAADETAGN